MFDTCLGKCFNCIPAQVLEGTISLDRQESISNRRELLGDEQRQAYLEYFRSRPVDGPPLGNLRGGVYRSAEEFADEMTIEDSIICDGHDSRVNDREVRLKKLVGLCPGLITAEFDVEDGDLETIGSCSSISAINALQAEFD